MWGRIHLLRALVRVEGLLQRPEGERTAGSEKTGIKERGRVVKEGEVHKRRAWRGWRLSPGFEKKWKRPWEKKKGKLFMEA